VKPCRGRLRHSEPSLTPPSLAYWTLVRALILTAAPDAKTNDCRADCRGFRIEVTAQHVEGAWDAKVRIRRTLSEEEPHVEVVTCRKPAAPCPPRRNHIADGGGYG